jgi:serine/threonine-protein kinase
VELDLTGRTLGDFHLLRRLGAGGMGQVYLAEQVSLSRKVALKILRPDLIAAYPEAMERFRLEAKAVARANHANIVQVYTHGEADGVCYIALEYVEGRNLGEYLARKGPPEVLLALSILRQVAAALQRAGELGIIHRDIKPENILLTRKGEVKVADFGLSRGLTGEQPLHLTQSGVTMGTPLYMSPEQVEGKPLDPRTDIYSLGVTCYHMLAGQPPFRGETAFEVALRHVRDEPVPLAQVRPDLPEALCAIVHKMMAKDPAQRYQTARDLLKDVVRLRESLNGQTAAVVPVSLSVEGVPVPAPATAAPGRGAATVVPVTPRGTPTVPTLPAAPRRPWRALLVVGSLAAALALGALVGWARRQGAGPTVAAATVVAEGEIYGLQEEEHALRVLAEKYLRQPAGGTEGDQGLADCVKLGLFYLAHDRLEDARAWFRTMEEQSMPGCRLRGRLGRGIVLALESKARESNQVFRDLVGYARDAAVKPREVFRGNLSFDLRFWLVKALEYNRLNGVRDEDVAPRVHVLAYGRPRN